MSLVKDLSEKILLLAEKSPIYQVDLTHILNVKHDQRISEALKPLIDSHKITRTPTVYNNKKTFLIKLNGNNSHKPKKTFSYTSNPCWACECSPEKIKDCTLLTNWAINPQ